MTHPLKWEPRDNRTGEWRAHLGKLRLTTYPRCRLCAPRACDDPKSETWNRYEWSIEGHECRTLASGGAPTRKAARAMAEAAARAAIKAGLR